MKTAKENFSERLLSQKRHPILQKLLSVLLCACLLLASLPMEGYGSEVQAEEPQRKILSFSQLPEEVKYQTVEPGTPLEELNLPETLEGVCVPVGQENNVSLETLVQPEGSPEAKGTAPEDESLSEETQKVSEDTDGEVLPEETQDVSDNENSEAELPTEHETEKPEPPAENGPEEQPESPIPDSEPEIEEVPEGNPEAGPETNPDSNSNTNTEETVVIEHVTWTGTPAYDSETEGVYAFAPVLPEGYVMAEGVALPEIQVTVKSGENMEGDGTGQKVVSEGKKEESEAGEELTEEYLGEAEEREYRARAASNVRVISEDEIWDNPETLSNVELVINEGVTLTLNNTATIEGTVTIRGGGTIEKGTGGASIIVGENDVLIMQNIIVDGKGRIASRAMISVNGGRLTVEDGCRIQNCKTRKFNNASLGTTVYLDRGTANFSECEIENCSSGHEGGAINSLYSDLTLNKCRIQNCEALNGGAINSLYSNLILNECNIKSCNASYGSEYSGSGDGGAVHLLDTTAEFNGCTIEDCSAEGFGGAVVNFGASILTINGGTYRNNRTMYQPSGNYRCGGGFLSSGGSYDPTVYIYDGDFSNNKAAGAGGAIYHANGKIYLYGGTFQGNSSSYEKCKGSGGVWINSTGVLVGGVGGVIIPTEMHFEMADGVNFCGDGTDSGVDGIYLDSRYTATFQKIMVSRTLSYPTTVYLEAVEGYVIAEGSGNYQLTMEDVRKFSVVDVKGESWYKKLDTEANQIYLTKEDPGYKKKILFADFYSGDPDLSESHREEQEVEEDVESVTITAPSLQDFSGWTPLGWTENAEGDEAYQSTIAEGENCTLSEDGKKYYGIYQKEVTLTYDSADKAVTASVTMPKEEGGTCYANVHEAITYQKAVFTLPSGPEVPGYNFKGWSGQKSGGGALYEADIPFPIQEDTTLYAVYEEKGKKTFTADFYSGNPLKMKTECDTVEETATEGTVTVPSPEPITGWNPLGWNKSKEAYTADDGIQPGRSLTLTEPLTEYYGIYEKDITLSYDSNGGDTAPEPEKKACYANVHQEVTQEYPEFTTAPALSREGYVFLGWNTEADGTGTSFEPGSTRKLDENTLLYAVWQEVSTAPETAPYRVEYYCQNLMGEEYTRMDSDTEILTGTVGTEAEASRKTYTGFTLNLSHPSGKPKGTVERDGSLVLKLYYDRLIYEVDFNLNGGQGKTPDMQKVRYGGLLEQVSDPLRRGYNFKGWYMDDKGLDGGIWDFGSPVEYNTGTLKTILYAKWADELAPAMGKASFSKGSRNFLDWLIQKESIVITVPVTEEGSGLEKAEYLLVAEDRTEQDGQAAFTELHTMTDTMTAYGSSAAVLRSIRGEAESGNYEARIAIEEEFKGKVYLSCTDYAGNVSAQKTLTAEGGGVIVEDNAPEIRFDGTKETTGGKPLEVKVEVRDSEEDRVTAGISGVRYQVDGKKTVSLPEEDFTGDFAETCEFTVKIKGEGKHTLRVEAEDHAGNESAAEVTLRISGSREVPEEVPADKNPENPGSPGSTGKPLGGEPQTGDSVHVQICATLAMIAGFGYLLLYFEGENGITEQEKEEMIHRIVTWAKQGGRIRKLFGVAIIFLFLAYYHSIGKSVTVEWKEVYGRN